MRAAPRARARAPAARRRRVTTSYSGARHSATKRFMSGLSSTTSTVLARPRAGGDRRRAARARRAGRRSSSISPASVVRSRPTSAPATGAALDGRGRRAAAPPGSAPRPARSRPPRSSPGASRRTRARSRGRGRCPENCRFAPAVALAEPLEDRPAQLGRDARPRVLDREQQTAARRRRRQRTLPPAGANLKAFDSRFMTTRCSFSGSTAATAALGLDREGDAPLRGQDVEVRRDEAHERRHVRVAQLDAAACPPPASRCRAGRSRA